VNRALASLVVTSALAAIGGCANERPRESATVHAEFGVLFGGQIQERKEIPFELDSTKQTLGFRIDFGAPLPSDVGIDWQIVPPLVARSRGKGAAPSASAPVEAPLRLSAHEVARAGETRFERAVDLKPGDPIGLYNARVVAGGRVVIDRAFEVYDAAARARAAIADSGVP
jgi:hypothetical protein